MKRLVLGTLCFVLISFAVQSISHFGVNAEHYGSVPFMRDEPIFALGFITMIIQGLTLTYLFECFAKNDFGLRKGLYFGLLISALFVSYPALVEPAKYKVPNILNWILVEGTVGLIQFAIFGVLLSLIFKKSTRFKS